MIVVLTAAIAAVSVQQVHNFVEFRPVRGSELERNLECILHTSIDEKEESERIQSLSNASGGAGPAPSECASTETTVESFARPDVEKKLDIERALSMDSAFTNSEQFLWFISKLYSTCELIHQTDHALIFKAISNRDGSAVVFRIEDGSYDVAYDKIRRHEAWDRAPFLQRAFVASTIPERVVTKITAEGIWALTGANVFDMVLLSRKNYAPQGIIAKVFIGIREAHEAGISIPDMAKGTTTAIVSSMFLDPGRRAAEAKNVAEFLEAETDLVFAGYSVLQGGLGVGRLGRTILTEDTAALIRDTKAFLNERFSPPPALAPALAGAAIEMRSTPLKLATELTFPKGPSVLVSLGKSLPMVALFGDSTRKEFTFGKNSNGSVKNHESDREFGTQSGREKIDELADWKGNGFVVDEERARTDLTNIERTLNGRASLPLAERETFVAQIMRAKRTGKFAVVNRAEALLVRIRNMDTEKVSVSSLKTSSIPTKPSWQITSATPEMESLSAELQSIEADKSRVQSMQYSPGKSEMLSALREKELKCKSDFTHVEIAHYEEILKWARQSMNTEPQEAKRALQYLSANLRSRNRVANLVSEHEALEGRIMAMKREISQTLAATWKK